MRNKRTFSLVFLTLLFHCAFSQEHKTLSSYSSSQPTITASGSITLLPGFTVPSGSSFHAYIVSGPSAVCVPLASAMSQNQNYVVTLTPRKPFDAAANLLDKSTCEVMQSVQYFDGLGRPLQTVQVKGSPNAEKDLVIPVAYDVYGREVRKYLPYASSSNNGSYKADGLTAQQNYYATAPSGVTGMPNPYSETRYEPSPLNRVAEQAAPGAAWQLGGGHTVRTEYTTNNADVFNSGTTSGSRRVALYTANTSTENSRTLSRANNNAVYANNQLYVTITKDENWKDGDGCVGTMEEYKDKQGQIVLKRTYNRKGSATEMLSTYYVYDDYGNLSFVLPPASNPDANAAISTATLNDLCYQYRYDGRNRMTGKKVPGKGWELMIYNPLDQLVMSQDALQRAKSPQQWSFTKYNAFGEVVMTGLYSDASGAADVAASPSDARRTALQTSVNHLQNVLWETRLAAAPAATETGYTNVSFPTTGVTMYLSINYYDDYAFPGGNPYPNNSYTQRLKGLLTGSRVKVLREGTGAGTTDMLWNVNYYDDKGRAVHTYNQHYKGGVITAANYDETLNSYNFTDELEISTRLHRASGASVVKVITEYEYDHMGRKKRTFQKIGDSGERVELASLSYNEVGQLKDKSLHNELQKTSYSYNPRGWLKTSSSAQFGMTLKYEDGASPQWNGNISAQEWNGGSYTYQYDKVNRLLSGIAADGRSEKSISYNLNGNMEALQRYTSGTDREDGLRFFYAGNRLSSVYDSVGTFVNTQYQQPGTTSYGYDLNGNMTARSNTVHTQNNLGLTYNILNLPQKVTQANGTVIQYVYDASGKKLRRVSGSVATEYISGIQYTGITLDFIQTEEGRAVPNGSSYKYEYNLSDHLGNVRYSFDSYNGSVRRLQQDDYYPFGLRISRVAGTTDNKYLYNGKEIQDELNQYDYGARFYDPVIGRWTTIDPHSEKYASLSPYNYVYNNPLKHIDPDGKDGIVSIKGNTITVSSNIYVYGSGATAANARQMQNDIMKAWGSNNGKPWTYTDGDGNTFNVKFDVSVSLYGGKEKGNPFIIPESWDPTNRDNFIEIGGSLKDVGRSYVQGGDEGAWRGTGRNGMSLSQDDPAPHEFGHLMGLGDRYTDSKGVNPGWAGNIMGESSTGKVEQRNINGILGDAMKAYEKFQADKNNANKPFKYEIDTNNPDKERR